MNDERWDQFVEMAKEKFEDVSLREDTWEMQDEGVPRSKGSLNILEFYDSNTDGRYRVVRENSPLVLEKKMFYSHRQGDTARSEYITSDTEFSHKVVVYRENDDGDWEEVRPESLGL